MRTNHSVRGTVLTLALAAVAARAQQSEIEPAEPEQTTPPAVTRPRPALPP